MKVKIKGGFVEVENNSELKFSFWVKGGTLKYAEIWNYEGYQGRIIHYTNWRVI